VLSEVIRMLADPDELWTVDQAVRELAKAGVYVEPNTIRVWVHRGHLPVADRVGGRLRFRPLDVARAEYATREHARRSPYGRPRSSVA
jgi:predicted site-specific integrase-resolvase